MKRLWSLLEAIPHQTTDRLEWRQLLQDEWPFTRSLLRSTGRWAVRLACPHPGGHRCPRKVVQHSDGRIVGVCGDRPQRCEPLQLQERDIEILAFDRSRLISSLCDLLGIAPALGRADAEARLLDVGDLPLLAGVSLKVVLAFPTPETPISGNELPATSGGETGGVLVTPTGRLVEPLPDAWCPLGLVDIVGVDAEGTLAISEGGHRLLADIRKQALARAGHDDPAAWRLPSDARWEEVEIQFISDEVVNVRFRGSTRRFEPEHLSMKDQRTGRPNVQWALLKTFADLGGVIQPAAAGRERDMFVKQKQELSTKLRLHFGMPDEPIPHDRRDRHFRTRFVVRGHGLRRGQDENSS